MSKKITIIKGKFGNIKIANTTFPLLRPVTEDKGIVTALVDASAILGDNFKSVLLEVEDYRSVD
jgi:hypothetical protein